MKDINGNQIAIDWDVRRGEPSVVARNTGQAQGPAPTKQRATEDITHQEASILRLIQRGKGNAIKVPVLEGATGLQGVEVRETIRHLIMEHSVLIASCTHGFFIAETAEEITEATRSLRHRGIMILMRAAKLQRISVEEVFGQARIEFEG